MPSLGVIIAYADNVLLLAKSKSDVASMTKALSAALEGHPVGRLRPSLQSFAPGEPVEFFGHRLNAIEGVVRVEPMMKTGTNSNREVKRELACLKRTKSAAARRERLRGWKSTSSRGPLAFALCDDIEKIRSDWLARAQAQFKEALKSASKENKADERYDL